MTGSYESKAAILTSHPDRRRPVTAAPHLSRKTRPSCSSLTPHYNWYASVLSQDRGWKFTLETLMVFDAKTSATYKIINDYTHQTVT
ncbi:hypothetical protein Pmani_023337 [Petrolisthes manimaculis]|uniref:Uncharacterized protein n=1 Tax=Petrolisthes manimaculis TaxID=1843537 RepID=A0AAE1PC26_9EUCA|nr:hypothetical protein Pmani_023337 [Petrolisthes manimaculis]